MPTLCNITLRSAARGCYLQAFDARLEELHVLHIAFLHSHNMPTLAILYQDNKEVLRDGPERHACVQLDAHRCGREWLACGDGHDRFDISRPLWLTYDQNPSGMDRGHRVTSRRALRS